MDNEYIKKCPFCGSLAEPRRYYNSYEGTKYFIACIQCGATSSHRPTEEYAIEHWNKRVEGTQHKQRTSKIAEKVEPKKYYLKHKFLGSEGFNYLNYYFLQDKLFLSYKRGTSDYQTKFTDKEIEEIEASGFDLCNFEKVEVE